MKLLHLRSSAVFFNDSVPLLRVVTHEGVLRTFVPPTVLPIKKESVFMKKEHFPLKRPCTFNERQIGLKAPPMGTIVFNRATHGRLMYV